MTKHLSAGEFIGEATKTVTVADAVMSLVRHTEGRVLESHTHGLAYFCILLDDGYAEHYADRTVVYEPFSLALHPPSFCHWDEIGSSGAVFFMIELSDTWNLKLGQHIDLSSVKIELRGNDLVWLAMRIFREFSEFSSESESQLHIEWLLLELTAAAARLPNSEEPVDEWFEKTITFVDENYGDRLTIQAIADVAGVHPLTLARTFRAKLQQTASEYINRLRVRKACQLILKGQSLVSVSAGCGFIDQAYFTRVFKGITGTTPSAFGKRLMRTMAIKP